MQRWLDLNLIYFLDFYFTLMFLVGTYRRFGQYRNIGRLAFAGPLRWPRLLKLIREHRMVFLTWTTLLPLALGLSLSLLQLIASRLIWPEAGRPPYGLTVGVLLDHWLALVVVVPLVVAVFGIDLYFLIRVGSFDRAQLEKYFDQAEFWLGSPTAHVVRVVTLGYIDPRRTVSVEVRKALLSASDLLNASLWWWNVQITLRFFFGLSLWLTWAFTQLGT
jgi:hypothetical protein